jgi:hypothetical protein
MPDLEINQIDLDYQKANECSALVVELYGVCFPMVQKPK